MQASYNICMNRLGWVKLEDGRFGLVWFGSGLRSHASDKLCTQIRKFVSGHDVVGTEMGHLNQHHQKKIKNYPTSNPLFS
jgi:hypothetical protein